MVETTNHMGGYDSQQLVVVLDASNICWTLLHTQPGWSEEEIERISRGKVRPPLTGLNLTFGFWKRYGVTPIAFCPSWWFNRPACQGVFGTEQWELEDFGHGQDLRNKGLLYLVPSGEHDDLYILDYTFRLNGFLCSNDKFRDHQRKRNLSNAWIEERRIGFMFVRNQFLPSADGINRLERFCKSENIFPDYSESAPALVPPPPSNGSLNFGSSSTAAMECDHLDVAPPSTQPSMHEGWKQASTSGERTGTSLQHAYAGQHSGHHTAKRTSTGAVKHELIETDSELVRFVIGKKGSKISELERTFNVNIVVHPSYKNEEQTSPKTTLIVAGKTEGVSAAVKAIHDTLEYGKSRIYDRNQGNYQANLPIISAPLDPVNRCIVKSSSYHDNIDMNDDDL